MCIFVQNTKIEDERKVGGSAIKKVRADLPRLLNKKPAPIANQSELPTSFVIL
jgi:hypothetical protein